MTVPPAPNAGLQRGELLQGGVGAGALVDVDDASPCLRTRPGRTRRRTRRPAARRPPAGGSAARSASCSSRRDRVLAGDVLGGLADGSSVCARACCGLTSRQPSAVSTSSCVPGQRLVGLGQHERRPAHRLDAAGDGDVAVAEREVAAARSIASRPEPHSRLTVAPGTRSAARRAAPPSGRRCGCPRRPGWRRRNDVARSLRVERRGCGRAAPARTVAARSSGRTPRGAPRGARSACGSSRRQTRAIAPGTPHPLNVFT